MRKAAINTLYRKMNAVPPTLRCVVYCPDANGGGILEDGRHVDAAEFEELTKGDNVMTLAIHTALQDN